MAVGLGKMLRFQLPELPPSVCRTVYDRFFGGDGTLMGPGRFRKYVHIPLGGTETTT